MWQATEDSATTWDNTRAEQDTTSRIQEHGATTAFGDEKICPGGQDAYTSTGVDTGDVSTQDAASSGFQTDGATDADGSFSEINLLLKAWDIWDPEERGMGEPLSGERGDGRVDNHGCLTEGSGSEDFHVGPPCPGLHYAESVAGSVVGKWLSTLMYSGQTEDTNASTGEDAADASTGEDAADASTQDATASQFEKDGASDGDMGTEDAYTSIGEDAADASRQPPQPVGSRQMGPPTPTEGQRSSTRHRLCQWVRDRWSLRRRQGDRGCLHRHQGRRCLCQRPGRRFHWVPDRWGHRHQQRPGRRFQWVPDRWGHRRQQTEDANASTGEDAADASTQDATASQFEKDGTSDGDMGTEDAYTSIGEDAADASRQPPQPVGSRQMGPPTPTEGQRSSTRHRRCQWVRDRWSLRRRQGSVT
ncbi:uncharacterized protein LOC143283500 [Babylonia areolata]|uniref:uncharacterized protein LOC143283500 n=1 Tax=Babylonia areolata TaxID=304850 RepID=UPI003FD4A364